MFKKFAVVVMLAGLLLTCAAPLLYAADHKMVISHYTITDPRNSGIAASLLYFKTMVESRTDGAIEVKIFGNMSLGSEVEYTREAVKGMTVQAALLSSGAFSSFFPKYQMITTPFLFSDYQTAWAFFDSPYFADLMEECRQETGLRYLGTYDDGGGFVAFTNNKKLIKTPEDMEGLRIRTEENPAHIAMIESLGAKAVPLSWGDVTTALASNVADGQFNAPYVNAFAKFWEVNEYSSWIGHVFNTAAWVVSDKWFLELPEEYQQIVLNTAREAVKIARGVDAQLSLLDWEEGKKHFKETYLPGPEVKEQWKAVLRPAFLQWITEDFGIEADVVKELWAEVDKIDEQLNNQVMEKYGRK